jgi:peptide/nickel transport system permease protein
VAAVSVPNFWLGLLLIVVFAVQLELLPTSGYYTTDALILPAVTLGLIHGGRIFLVVRSVTFEEMTKPYVLVVQSKGLPSPTVLGRHVLRNAGVTIATTVGWEYVRMMGGAAFAIEFVFAWPGVGNLMIDAANRQDFPVLQAGVIVAGTFVIVTNMLVDIGSQIVDRRLNAAGGA